MKIYDVSVPISASLPVWPDDPRVEIQPRLRTEEGDQANVSLLTMTTHSGTHVDPPYHFVQDGIKVDQIPLDTLVGPAYVCELTVEDGIEPGDLEQADLPAGVERLLLKTSNSRLWSESPTEFRPGYAHLTPDAAQWVVDRGVKLVGVDYLSVQGFYDEEPATHLTLLGSGVVILEGLNLSEVPAGAYELVCLPLKIVGGDGAPARAILTQRP